LGFVHVGADFVLCDGDRIVGKAVFVEAVALLVEVLLPLSVMLFGAVVWWRRR